MPALFEAYVTNLGKYNEGELVGEYLKFPTTPEEVQALLKRIGIDGVRYEEIFITDFDGDVLGLYDHLGQYENIDELTEVDKTLGLGLGADDYITKPFSVVEVVARVKANIRRTTEYAAPIQEPEELTFRSLKMDLSNHTVTKNGVLLELTAKEFDILKLLLQNPKRVYTKAQIYSLIWNDVYVGDENAVNVHISRLRNKIEDNPRSPECVITVWGIGYKLGEPT